MSKEKLQAMLARPHPVTIPAGAYGPDPIEWFNPHRSVWAWIPWPDRPMERVQATAYGANDRVVMIQFQGSNGTVDLVVWRNAVTVRA